MNILAFILSVVFGYILGSVNFAIILSKIFKKEDIRVYGSGNAGMTNMLRTYGIKYGVLTLLGDILKGVLAATLGGVIYRFLGNDTIVPLIGMYICGIFAILGHIFPIFFKFKGGKAIATSAGVVGVISPSVIIILLVIFLLIVGFSRYISLGSIICAIAYPIITGFLSYRYNRPVIIETCLASFIALLVIFMHRSNIGRLLKGTENKLSFSKKNDN